MRRNLLNVVLLNALTATVYAASPAIPASDTPGAQLQDRNMPRVIQALPKEAKVPTLKKEQTVKKNAATEKKFRVSKIDVQGVVAHPKYKINSQAITALANQLLKQAGGKDGKVNIVKLQQIAQGLTAYYRSQGFILTQVYLPRQKVGRERVIIMKVQEGILGGLIVEGKLYSKAEIERPFKGLVGEPVRAKQIEAALLKLNAFYPGLKVSGVFKAGKKPGETILVIKENKADKVSVVYSYDNYASESTGKYRSQVSVTGFDLTGAPDALNVSFMQKISPSLSQLASLFYKHRFFWSTTQWFLGYTYNTFNLGGDLEPLNIYGDSKTGYIGLSQQFVLSRANNFSGNIQFKRLRGTLKQDGVYLNKDNLSIAELGLSYNHNSFSWHNANIIALTYDHGFNNVLGAMGENPSNPPPTRQSVNGDYASGKFNLIKLHYTFLQKLFGNSLLTLAVSGQYTPNLITSFNQLQVGGPFSLAGYANNEYLMDSGVVTQLDYRFPIFPIASEHAFGDYTWGELIKLNLFTDYANAFLRQATASDTAHVTPADYGAGLSVELVPYVRLYVMAAKPYGFSKAASDGKKTRYWGAVTVAYHW